MPPFHIVSSFQLELHKMFYLVELVLDPSTSAIWWIRIFAGPSPSTLGLSVMWAFFLFLSSYMDYPERLRVGCMSSAVSKSSPLREKIDPAALDVLLAADRGNKMNGFRSFSTERFASITHCVYRTYVCRVQWSVRHSLIDGMLARVSDYSIGNWIVLLFFVQMCHPHTYVA